LALASALGLFGCAAVKPQSPNGGGGGGAGGASTGDAARDAAPPTTDGPSFDFMTSERPPPAPGKVYAHSDGTLWLLEPISKQVTMVGAFDCVASGAVSSMVDIAVDRTGKMTGSAAISFNNALGGALVSIDPTNAHCTVLTRGADLVTSLTYVPEGTLVANAEALVGYADDRYVRVDPTTGALTQIGLLNDAASGGVTWVSSGDGLSLQN